MEHLAPIPPKHFVWGYPNGVKPEEKKKDPIMTAKEMGNSALAGFWWGAGFTIAFVLVRLVMLAIGINAGPV